MLETVPLIHLVDDGQDVLDFVSELLRGSGYEVRSYVEPQEFLDSFQPRHPECLLLDLRLPRMSGLEVQRRLQLRSIAMPVIIMTGYGSVPAAVQALKLGAEDFLEKPLDPEILLDTVGRAIAKDKKRTELRRHKQQVLDLLATLSPRERTVFEHLVEGHSSKSIAFHLSLSKKTIDLHRSRVMKKLGTTSLAALTRLSMVQCFEPDAPVVDAWPARDVN